MGEYQAENWVASFEVTDSGICRKEKTIIIDNAPVHKAKATKPLMNLLIKTRRKTLFLFTIKFRIELKNFGT
jgi:hypothetical protein